MPAPEVRPHCEGGEEVGDEDVHDGDGREDHPHEHHAEEGEPHAQGGEDEDGVELLARVAPGVVQQERAGGAKGPIRPGGSGGVRDSMPGMQSRRF